MLRYEVRPLSDRTPFTGRHVDSRFSATWISTLDLLQREFVAVSGRNLVIELHVDYRQIRNDGLLRADAVPASPAVRVAFDSKHGPIVMATDKLQRPTWGAGRNMQSWQHNVRAIAMTLEALRAVDRYGVTRRGEQYTGWKALPSGIALPAPEMTIDEAAGLLCEYAASMADPAQLLTDSALARSLYKQAARRTHPDVGGDRSDFERVNEAARLLGVTS